MQQVTITNARGVKIQYDLEPWLGSHAIEMLRRLLPLLQGAVATSGAIMARAKDTQAARYLGAIFADQAVDVDDFDMLGLVNVLGEVSEKAGNDIAGAIGWIADVLKREGDGDLFLRLLDGCTRRTLGESDGKRFDFTDHASLMHFDHVYRGNLSELFVVAVHILRLNFEDFFRLGNDPAPSPATDSGEGASEIPRPKREPAKKRRSLAK